MTAKKKPRPETGPRLDALIELDVTGMTLEGAGFGTVEGVQVVVPGTYPGDRAVARVEDRSRHHPLAHARLRDVLRPAHGRRPPPCVNDVARGGRCNGCALSGLEPAAQREAKRALLVRDFGLEPDGWVHGNEFGYRLSSKRIAYATRAGVELGSFRRGSHRGASMGGCLVDHPLVTRVADHVEALARRMQIEAFDESTGGGDLRAVWLKTDGDKVLVTLVGRAGGSTERLAKALTDPAVAGVHCAEAHTDGNDLRGAHPRRVRGVDALVVRSQGVEHVATPLGFLQPNPEVASSAQRDLVRAADGSEQRGALAFDVYAGAGHVTRLLRRTFDRVLSCESDEAAAAALGVPASTAARFLEAYVGEVPDLVVANPPRAGLGDAVCTSLVTLGPKRLAIMSCHPASLARDLVRLEAKGYRRVGCRAYDTLPNTPHVELVVWLERT